MAEFGALATLGVEVPDAELRQARREIEESIGDISVTVDGDVGGTGTGTGTSPGPSTLADGGQDLGSLLVEQTDVLEDIHDLLERQGGIGGGGGGGGGLLSGIGLASLFNRGAGGGIGLASLLPRGSNLLKGLGIGGMFELAGSDIGLPEGQGGDTFAPEGSPGANIERRWQLFEDNVLPEFDVPEFDVWSSIEGAFPGWPDGLPEFPGWGELIPDPGSDGAATSTDQTGTYDAASVTEGRYEATDRTDGVVDQTGADVLMRTAANRERGGIDYQGGDHRLEEAATATTRPREGGDERLQNASQQVTVRNDVSIETMSRRDANEIERIVERKNEELRREIERSIGTRVR